ncbi:hypothetical protein LLG10_08630 [bacterium]|nr:hypothetical protein [bacterium]
MNRTKFVTKIVTNEKHEPKYVNGAFGSFNLQGELLINFFFDSPSLPESSEIDFKDDDASHQEVFVDTGEIERRIQASLLMNISSLKSVYSWIGEKIEELEKSNQKTNEIVKE